MTIWDLLISPRTFGQMVDLILGLIGTNFLYVAVGFLAFAGFLVLGPSSGVFSGLSTRIGILFLFTQVLNVSVLFLLLATFQQAFVLLVYFLPLGLIGYLTARDVAKGFTYNQIIGMKYYRGLDELVETGKRYLSLVALVVALPAEVFLLDSYNPTLPFLAWVLLFYQLLLSFFTASPSLGTVFQVRIAQPSLVRLDNGEEIRGLVIGKSSDHVNVLTPENNLFVQTGHILTIAPTPPPPRAPANP